MKQLETALLSHPAGLADLLRRPELGYEDICKLAPPKEPLSSAAADTVEAEVKYGAYIKKEKRLVEQMKELEEKVLPSQLDYDSIKALSLEAREKLGSIKPRTLGQASRIPGVSPADIAVLMVYLRGGGAQRE